MKTVLFLALFLVMPADKCGYVPDRHREVHWDVQLYVPAGGT